MTRASCRSRVTRALVVAAALATCMSASLAADVAASAPTRASAPQAPEPALQFVMAITANIDPVIDMGKAPLGARRVITISGGTFEGAGIKGTIMPGG